MTHFLPVKKRILCILLSAVTLLSSSGCASASGPGNTNLSVSDTGFYLDTVVTITLFGTQDRDLIQECFSLMEGYEDLFSRTKEGSDIWKINHSGGLPVSVSEETADLIRLALTYCERSGGVFDITIAPVVELWDFHEKQSPRLPEKESLQEALKHVDYRAVSLEDTTVTLSDPEAAIDLGGIAKGYISDRIKEYLLSKGISCALIDLGGNILTVGEKPNGQPWRVGVRKPFGENASDLSAVVTVRDQSVVTSGSYERCFELDGVLYHHILNPETGFPADTGLLSVSIVSDSSAEGDALSTACFLLGAQGGLELIEAIDGTEALFITDEQQILLSSGFPIG